MELFGRRFKRSVSILILIIFTLSSIYTQEAFSLTVERNNISPQSVFLPFEDDHHIKDIGLV